nr:tyrosine-type recombinase/integrase [Gracilibacillus orientalis]
MYTVYDILTHLLLFEAGASIKEVQARLGHKDIQTTMNVYTHVFRIHISKNG